MREDVVVPEVGYDGYAETAGDREGISELVGQQAIRAEDLGRRARYGFVRVMAGTVTGPDDKVYVVAEILGDPVECGVDQRDGCVAVGCFCAISSCRALAAVACTVCGCGAVNFVKVVWVEIWPELRKTLAPWTSFLASPAPKTRK